MRMEIIERFNQENAPFYLANHGDNSVSLCLELSFLSDEYMDFGQYAFDAYAKEIGDPITQNGFYTHGDGYEWKAVFRKVFADDPALENISFDSEAGGFFCNGKDVDAMVSLGTRFRQLVLEPEKFKNIVPAALRERANQEAYEKEMQRTVGGFLELHPTATVDLLMDEGHIRISPERAKELKQCQQIQIYDGTGNCVTLPASYVLNQEIAYSQGSNNSNERYTVVLESQENSSQNMELKI